MGEVHGQHEQDFENVKEDAQEEIHELHEYEEGDDPIQARLPLPIQQDSWMNPGVRSRCHHYCLSQQLWHHEARHPVLLSKIYRIWCFALEEEDEPPQHKCRLQNVASCASLFLFDFFERR